MQVAFQLGSFVCKLNLGGTGNRGCSFRLAVPSHLWTMMTATELLQHLSAFPGTSPLIAEWATEEVCTFAEDGLPFVLRVPHHEPITSVNAAAVGGGLLLHAESHDQRVVARRLLSGAITVGQLVEFLEGRGDFTAVRVIYHDNVICIEGVEGVGAHWAVVSTGRAESEYVYLDTGLAKIYCQSAEPVG